MSKKQKTKDDVVGYIEQCLNFEACPLCYGCRNYDEGFMKCSACAVNAKQNICDTSRHKAKLVAQMIKTETIKI